MLNNKFEIYFILTSLLFILFMLLLGVTYVVTKWLQQLNLTLETLIKTKTRIELSSLLS